VTSVIVPPHISFIDWEAFPADSELSVSECDSCVELTRWCAFRSRSNSHSAVDFRRTLRIGHELPVMADSLIDLSVFDLLGRPGVGDAGQGEGEGCSLLYQRRSDGIQFVVELIGHMESSKGEGGESEIERAIEKLLNLRHPCIAAPIGFAVSNAGGDAVELRTVRPYAEGGSLADVLAGRPPQWTATAKAVAVAALALGLRFANGVGQPHGGLGPKWVLFDGAGTVHIAGIGAVRGGSGGDAEFVAPEIESGGAPTAKADVFSFSRIVSRIASEDPHRRSVPPFVADLIEGGLSADPCDRPSFGAILARLEANCFEIVEGVDSDAVSAFVRAVEAAEP
jgi:hypothetical protein